jgi:outer membrane protein
MQSLIVMVGFWAIQQGSALQNSTTLTLGQAVALASTQAFSIRTAKVNVGKAQDLVDLAKTGQGLNVSLNGGYTRIEQQGVKQSPGGFGGGFAGGPPQDETKVSLAINQVIDITGALGKAVSQARLNKEAQEMLVLAEVNGVKARVRSAYFQILQTDSLIAVQQTEVNAAKERLSKAEVRFKNDAIPKFDVIRFETELRRSEQALIDAKLDATLARQNLNNILGRPIETTLEVVPVTGLPSADLNPDTVTQVGLSRRPDLLAAEKSLQALIKVMEREKLGMGPQLSVSASHSEVLGPVSIGAARGQTVAGINVSLPLYDSHSTRTKVRSASKDIENAQIQLELARLGIALEIRSALSRLISAQESLTTAQKTKELSQESLRLAQLRYDENVGLFVDLVTAQAEFTRAANAVVLAEYQYLTAYAEIQRAAGSDTLTLTAPAAAAQPGEKK